jgi:DNA polymerase III subunit gamma/tau
MEKVQATINLARRLRPQQFSQIIGQDLPVRMLKNSLYMNKFFPVYLLAGQRGCGKTSTARVFAAAVNCEALTSFQQNPTLTDIPCLTCSSCLAMKRNAHPDFIEIDAASNTGVDNVRQLIETAAYVPLQGKKKVYLIDEAHMLSKAAFNAFLKILEEPPVTVLFMLATTELHKIPQTVLSRCFQLFFPALEQQAFTNYLQEVCKREAIDIEDSALSVLIHEADGSARDALNLLEQVRFIESPVTESSIRKILGKLSTPILLDLIEAAVTNNPTSVLTVLSSGALQSANPNATWDLLVSAIKTILWIKYASPTIPGEFMQHRERLNEITQTCSHNRLIAIMQLLWDQERIFLQTSKKHAFLEFLFLQLAEQDNIAGIDELLQGLTSGTISPRKQNNSVQQQPKVIAAQPATVAPPPQPQVAAPAVQSPPSTPAKEESITQIVNSDWAAFLVKLHAGTDDSLLLAILGQATNNSPVSGEITLALRQHSKFFTEKLDEMKPTWFPVLQEIFGPLKKVSFIQQDVVITPPKAPVGTIPAATGAPTPRPRPTQPVAAANNSQYKSFKTATPTKIPEFEGEFITPSPANLPFASLLLGHFPGKLKRLKIST